MLSRITVSNLVIVRRLDLPFGPGMTALTGETGAGKSILIDALGLALGDKADGSMIRTGADKAEINVGFDIDETGPIADWLQQRDLTADGECLLRRVLVRGGRSRAYINGTPTTTTALRELGEQLVDIHGQNAHQSLLKTQAQRALLDEYAGLDKQVQKVKDLFTEWRTLVDRHEQLRQAGEDRVNRLDYLRFQIDELDSLVCDGETLETLEAEHARLAHAERLLSDGSQVLATLEDNDPALRHRLQEVLSTITELSELDPSLHGAKELLESAGIQIDEAVAELRHYQDRIELDPERLQEIDHRLGRLHDAARKHRTTPAELEGLLQQLRDEATTLEHADSELQQLAERIGQCESSYFATAEKLSTARRKAAKTLSSTVSDSMQTLGMRGGNFSVNCTKDRTQPGAHGMDHIRFMVAANPGQPAAALSDVASGGELSRISLAIQVATANCGAVPTLIFDEVDVGIGGAVAEIVGNLLRRLGNERQVLCVTHLPQVASQAHQQLRVQKVTDGDTTETHIEQLDADKRIDEIARMLGGIDITEQTLRHADEMIRQAQDAS